VVAQGPIAIIAREPDGPALANLVVRLNGDATGSTLPLYVKPKNSDLTNVRFFVQLADANGQPLAGPNFTFLANGAEIPEAGINIPADKQVLVAFKIANVSVVGKFTGSLYAERKGERTALSALTLERYPLPVLKVSGVTEPGGIKLTSGDTAWRYRFRIESMNLAPVDALSVSVGPLTGPNGAQVETQWKIDGKSGPKSTVAVPGLGAVEGEVSATLSLTGGYAGTVTLIYADRRESIPLIVTRAKPQPAVELLGIETGRGTSFWLGGDSSFWFTLQGTSGQKVTLDLPAIAAFSRRGPNQSKLQAQFQGIQVSGEDGKELTQPVVLEPGKPQRMRVTIRNLDEAGEYLGTLRVTAPDMQPIDQPLTLLMKDSIWIAIILIFIGVLGSYLLRQWVKLVRPRLVRQQRVQALLDDLERLAGESTSKSTAAQEVLGALRNRLDGMSEQLVLGTAQNIEVTLEEINQKLSLFPRWTEALSRVAAMEPANLRSPLQGRLDQIETFLRGKEVQNLSDHSDFLDGLRNQIIIAVRNELTTKIAEFRDDVAQQRVVTQLAASRFDPIVQQLDDAEKLAQSDHPDSAHAPIQKARGLYAALLAEELDTIVAGSARPPALSAPDWKQEQDAVRAESRLACNQAVANPDAANLHYQAAYTRYLKVLAGAMKKDIDDRTLAYQPQAAFTSEMRDKLVGIKERMNTVIHEAEAKQFRSAARKYAEAKQDLESLIASIAQKGVSMGVAGVAVAVPNVVSSGQAPVATATLGAPTASSVREPREKLAVDWFRQLLFTGDTLVLLGTVIIAVLLGLKLLYLDDPTWGGGNAYLIAILWGVGLHQVSGSAFEGLVGLKERLFG
jgi:hypothetical protein